MKNLILVLPLVIVIVACRSKKTAPAANPPQASEVKTPPSPPPLPLFRPENGVYEPGQLELAEIRLKDSTVTMARLQEGYYIYAKGECIRCHGPANVYRYEDSRWPGLLGDMAMRAHISESQKNAVFSYVMAVRAVKAAGK